MGLARDQRPSSVSLTALDKEHQVSIPLQGTKYASGDDQRKAMSQARRPDWSYLVKKEIDGNVLTFLRELGTMDAMRRTPRFFGLASPNLASAPSRETRLNGA